MCEALSASGGHSVRRKSERAVSASRAFSPDSDHPLWSTRSFLRSVPAARTAHALSPVRVGGCYGFRNCWCRRKKLRMLSPTPVCGSSPELLPYIVPSSCCVCCLVSSSRLFACLGRRQMCRQMTSMRIKISRLKSAYSWKIMLGCKECYLDGCKRNTTGKDEGRQLRSREAGASSNHS